MPPTGSAGYREVLADPRFRLLFGSRSLAVAGDTLRTVALAVLVLAATGSPLLAALSYGVAFLPEVVGGTLLGALSDRLRPRPLIAAGYLAECLVAVAVAVLRLPVAGNLAVVAVLGALAPVSAGASARLVAETLPGDAYVLGRSLSGMAVSAAQLVGLAGGGAAVATLGPRHALLVAAACPLVSAVAVRTRLPDLPSAPGGEGVAGSAVRQSLAAARALLADRRVRLLMLAQWLPPMFVTGADAQLVAYARERGFPVGSLGLLLASLPVGMTVGAALFGRLVRPATRDRLAVPMVALLGVPLLAFAARPALPVAAVLLVLTGAGLAYDLAVQTRFRDAVPTDRRGQAFGLLGTGLMTVQGVSPPVLGAVAQVGSAGLAVALAGAGTVLTAVGLRRLHVRRPPSVRSTSGGIPYAGRMTDRPDGRHPAARRRTGRRLLR